MLQFGWACTLGGMESQGISKAGQTVLVRLMESLMWHPPPGSVDLWEESSEKGQWSLWPHCLGGEKAVPHVSPGCQTLQFLAVYHCCLSSCYCGAWAQWEWVRKCMGGCLRRTAWDFSSFFLLIQSVLVFAARSYGVPGVSLRLLCPETFLLYFIHHTWIWTQPVPHLCHSYQSGWMWFL